MSSVPLTNSNLSFIPNIPLPLKVSIPFAFPMPLSSTDRSISFPTCLMVIMQTVALLCFTTLVTASFKHILNIFSRNKEFFFKGRSSIISILISAASRSCLTRMISSFNRIRAFVRPSGELLLMQFLRFVARRLALILLVPDFVG